MESRIKIALEFLKDGKPFSVGDLRLELNNIKCPNCYGVVSIFEFSKFDKI